MERRTGRTRTGAMATLVATVTLAACAEDPAEIARYRAEEEALKTMIIRDAAVREGLETFIGWGMPGGVHGLQDYGGEKIESVFAAYDPAKTSGEAVIRAFSEHCKRIGRTGAEATPSGITTGRNSPGGRRKLPAYMLKCVS
ncbi:hypothetical protein OEZ71_02400 [Defluviimonas sp. WL0050]|uniref:Lipoprotein n=1 Tax=Albidovulum litorale TaxID=2984134 RepID=A0ABT2ZK58_9RHOB|nr:hypothetical protein [Defluviimonas sp. WL0050]MCV2871141.1 hypothetical protein [Defluviimonas sp. WL0050]